MIEAEHMTLSIRRQCELLGLSRASYYYTPAVASALNLELMRRIDEQYMETPFYGWPRMTAHLQRLGHAVNHKRVQQLMRLMGLEAIYPKPHTTVADPGHCVYPDLLRDLAIVRPNQVWSADITYVPMAQGIMYLVAILDWYSRYVLAWQLSNTLGGRFCVATLDQTLRTAQSAILDTDQGVQFTAQAFTQRLLAADIQISMDGRGRALDNIFVEQLWRSVKYEHLYLHDYRTVPETGGRLDTLLRILQSAAAPSEPGLSDAS
jgi:putative transposase